MRSSALVFSGRYRANKVPEWQEQTEGQFVDRQGEDK
jgi:hypothetical protein